MYTIYSRYWVIGVVVLTVALAPSGTQAAEVKFAPVAGNGTVESMIRVDVRIDPQSKKLNVVEGVIQVGGTASSSLTVHVENGQSVLPIWPAPPQYDAVTKSIRFTGGVPNGFDSEGLLFRVLISSATPGDLTLSYTEGSAYINDGKGTREPVNATPLTIQIGVPTSSPAGDNSLRSNTHAYGIIVLILGVCAGIFIYGLRHKETH